MNNKKVQYFGKTLTCNINFLPEITLLLTLLLAIFDTYYTISVIIILVVIIARNSARLTDQRGRHAFSCSSFTIHVLHLLPTSDIKHVL